MTKWEMSWDDGVDKLWNDEVGKLWDSEVEIICEKNILMGLPLFCFKLALKHMLTIFLAKIKKLTFNIIVTLMPLVCYAEDDFLQVDPWDRALKAVLQIMIGPTATIIGAIALAGTGYLFLRGRVDVMRLMAIIAGLALIFGAPHLAALLQQHAA